MNAAAVAIDIGSNRATVEANIACAVGSARRNCGLTDRGRCARLLAKLAITRLMADRQGGTGAGASEAARVVS